MPKTRKGSKHFLLGHPSPLPCSRFPLKGEVVNYLKYLSQAKGDSKSPRASVIHDVAAEVSNLWTVEGIPIYDQKQVVKKN